MKKLIVIGIVALASALLPAQAEDVKVLFKKECSKCHGEDGKGETKMGKKLGAKDYTDPKVQEAMKDDNAIKVIREGLKEDGKTKMQPDDKLTDAQIKALIAHMRTFKKT